MDDRPRELTSLFKNFKKGDAEALEAIIQNEKAWLFDYLIRMTGQVSKSVDVMQEAINVMIPVADQEEELQDLLVLLYRTARSFAMDVWNADTSKLENSAYTGTDQHLQEPGILELVEIERVLRSLPAKQREVILLHLRYKFTLADVSDITGYDEDDVKEYFDQGKNVLTAALGVTLERASLSFLKLKVFSVPDETSDGTQNLSMVVRDLKKSSKSTPGGIVRLFTGIILLGLIAYLIVNHQMVFDYLETISSP